MLVKILTNVTFVVYIDGTESLRDLRSGSVLSEIVWEINQILQPS